MHVGRLLDSQCDAEVVVHFGDACGHHDRSTERGERRLDACAHLERKARVGVSVVVVVVVIVRVLVVAEDTQDYLPLHSLARAAQQPALRAARESGAAREDDAHGELEPRLLAAAAEPRELAARVRRLARARARALARARAGRATLASGLGVGVHRPLAHLGWVGSRAREQARDERGVARGARAGGRGGRGVARGARERGRGRRGVARGASRSHLLEAEAIAPVEHDDLLELPRAAAHEVDLDLAVRRRLAGARAAGLELLQPQQRGDRIVEVLAQQKHHLIRALLLV